MIAHKSTPGTAGLEEVIWHHYMCQVCLFNSLWKPSRNFVDIDTQLTAKVRVFPIIYEEINKTKLILISVVKSVLNGYCMKEKDELW